MLIYAGNNEPLRSTYIFSKWPNPPSTGATVYNRSSLGPTTLDPTYQLGSPSNSPVYSDLASN